MLDNKHTHVCAELLKNTNSTIAVAESSTGGLISAALLSVPGASAYFLGGAVIYTRESRKQWVQIPREKLAGVKPMTEEMAMLFAEAAREKLGATWGISELGAAGPTGTPYGYDAGTSVIAISGPQNASTTVLTGISDREQNMELFTASALELLADTLTI